MAKSRKRKKSDRPAAPASEAGIAGRPRWFRIDDLAAGLGISACITLTWFSQWALNVDGVSYLDLARAAQAGDWDSVVQGYWSPLYPMIIGLLAPVTGSTPTALILVSHVVNGLAAIGAIALLWWWGRVTPRPYFGAVLIAVFLLASTGLPRIEAVTPDVLLLGLMCWVAYELLHHRGGRPIATGIALGLSFLAKTSVWPWLILSIPLRLWSADGPRGRRAVVVSSGIALLFVGAWVVPLSLEAGRPTLGSAGRLNYMWYIEAHDSRTPDTHSGRHRDARAITVDSARSLEVVRFDESSRWTYAPWSDPTAWSAGVLSSNGRFPSISDLVAYWGRQAGWTFGFWLLPVLLGVVVPCAVAIGNTGAAARSLIRDRERTTLLLLGLAGMLQFVAVHSEPRLIAPFVMLVGIAVLDGLFADPAAGHLRTTRGLIAVAVAWLVVVWLSSIRLTTAVTAGARSAAAAERILANQAIAALSSPTPTRILVAGPALPVAPAAFIAGVRIVAQVPPRSLLLAQSLPPAQQDSFLRSAADGRVTTAWITDRNGAVRVVQIPTP